MSVAGTNYLFEQQAQNIEQVCVKCGKPHSFDFSELVIRCPHCQDFFKPKAELIFLYEEELNKLLLKRPGRVFFEHPWLKKLLFGFLIFAVLFSPGLYKLFYLFFLALLVWVQLRMHKSPVIEKIHQLEKCIQELEDQYQREIEMESDL